MFSLDDVYTKFGEVAETAQLFETEIGTLLLLASMTDAGIARVGESGLEISPNPQLANKVSQKVNRNTLGQLMRNLLERKTTISGLEPVLSKALTERNRLFHSFYRQHNFRRNSTEGRSVMIADLEEIRLAIQTAYEALLPFTGMEIGIEFDNALNTIAEILPTTHVPI